MADCVQLVGICTVAVGSSVFLLLQQNRFLCGGWLYRMLCRSGWRLCWKWSVWLLLRCLLLLSRRLLHRYWRYLCTTYVSPSNNKWFHFMSFIHSELSSFPLSCSKLSYLPLSRSKLPSHISQTLFFPPYLTPNFLPPHLTDTAVIDGKCCIRFCCSDSHQISS